MSAVTHGRRPGERQRWTRAPVATVTRREKEGSATWTPFPQWLHSNCLHCFGPLEMLAWHLLEKCSLQMHQIESDVIMPLQHTLPL